MRRSGLATTSGSAGTGPGNDTGVWLIITIILFALLCNYSRTICLIDVGTEGSTLEETLKALYKRRSEISRLLRSLEAERSNGFEHPLKIGGTSDKKERSARVSRGHQRRHSSTESD